MQDGNDMEQDNNDGLILGEDEVYAWRELRLHPLLITAVRRLGFKEPTPIQKACFPAAAHQGKVCQVLTCRPLAKLLYGKMMNFYFIIHLLMHHLLLWLLT